MTLALLADAANTTNDGRLRRTLELEAAAQAGWGPAEQAEAAGRIRTAEISVEREEFSFRLLAAEFGTRQLRGQPGWVLVVDRAWVDTDHGRPFEGENRSFDGWQAPTASAILNRGRDGRRRGRCVE